jgi:hypothetical protein
MMTPSEKALALILAREAEEAWERAVGWVAFVRHRDHPNFPPTVWGTFEEAPAALEFAASREAELNVEGETGFRIDVLPVLPLSRD